MHRGRRKMKDENERPRREEADEWRERGTQGPEKQKLRVTSTTFSLCNF